MKKQYIMPTTAQVMACPQNILLGSDPTINVGGEGSGKTADAPKRMGVMYI